jgi:integrase
MPDHPDIEEALSAIGHRDHSITAEYRIFGPPGTGKTTNLTRQIRRAVQRFAEGCDFPGLGPHSFRRANITWRQEVGGSSIETSKIAGHSTVRMTEEYTKIQLSRQEELTRLIQERLASVGERQLTVVQ